MSNPTEDELIANYAKPSPIAKELAPSTVYGISGKDGTLVVVDTDNHGQSPRRKTASSIVRDAASFCAYVNKHGNDYATEVWADTPSSTVIAVINSHQGDDLPGGWRDHRLTLSLEKTTAWKAWEQFDGKWFNQLDFADFVELRASDIHVPEPTYMLELAQHFQAKRSIDFESSSRINNGETHLVYSEKTTGAKAGEKGGLDIPDKLRLILKPYIGGPSYWVWARFRYRIDGGALALGYVLERPIEILEAAFVDIVEEIRSGKEATEAREATENTPSVLAAPGHPGITQPILYGKP
jgi:uncharacterized protein YfdQ (DUF2303 family)